MEQEETPYLYGATILLDECEETMRILSERLERADDERTRRELAVAAEHELKVQAAIKELLLAPSIWHHGGDSRSQS